MSKSDIDIYLSEILKHDALSASVEKSLATRVRENADVDAEAQLINSQLKLVAYIAKKYLGYGLPLEDLIQEGNIGLTKAVRRFNPEKGARLSTFAGHAINAEILDFVMRNWRIVRVATTAEQKKLFFNLRKSKRDLGWLKQDDVENLADNLSVKSSTVKEMEYRMAGGDTSFDAPSSKEGSKQLSPAQTMHAENADPSAFLEHHRDNKESIQNLCATINDLDPRSRDVLKARWLQSDAQSIQDVLCKYSITNAQMKQIERTAFKKLRSQLIAA